MFCCDMYQCIEYFNSRQAYLKSTLIRQIVEITGCFNEEAADNSVELFPLVMFTCIVVDQISYASSVDVATKERSEEALEVRYLPEQ